MSWVEFESKNEKVKIRSKAVMGVALKQMQYTDDDRYEVVVALNGNTVSYPGLDKEAAENLFEILTAQREQNAKEPLGCPFCGSKDIFVENDPNEGYYCHCMTCESFGPFGETKEKAISLWNRREGC